MSKRVTRTIQVDDVVEEKLLAMFPDMDPLDLGACVLKGVMARQDQWWGAFPVGFDAAVQAARDRGYSEGGTCLQ